MKQQTEYRSTCDPDYCIAVAYDEREQISVFRYRAALERVDTHLVLASARGPSPDEAIASLQRKCHQYNALVQSVMPAASAPAKEAR